MSLRILIFADLWGNDPDDAGEERFQTSQPLARFVRAVAEGAARVLAEYGEAGYREAWVEHDFPIDSLGKKLPLWLASHPDERTEASASNRTREHPLLPPSGPTGCRVEELVGAKFPTSFAQPYTVRSYENWRKFAEVADAPQAIAAGSTADSCESVTLDFKREGRSVQDAAKALAEATATLR